MTAWSDHKKRPWLAMVVMVLLVGACGNNDPEEWVTTTTAAPVTTTTAPSQSTTTLPPTTTAVEETPETTIPAPESGEADRIFYRVVRQESTRDGKRLFVEIPGGDYSDIDLENLVMSVFEGQDDLYEVHVFDNREAVTALITSEAERTTEQVEMLERHYLVSLLEGTTLRFQGPYADLGGFVIGS